MSTTDARMVMSAAIVTAILSGSGVAVATRPAEPQRQQQQQQQQATLQQQMAQMQQMMRKMGAGGPPGSKGRKGKQKKGGRTTQKGAAPIPKIPLELPGLN